MGQFRSSSKEKQKKVYNVLIHLQIFQLPFEY